MLLTELILSKRGPLAKVWLSAHHERKLSKQQALGVDVEESIGIYLALCSASSSDECISDAILTQEDGPITLRLSGQLMLGVTRIYSRKVQYLLDDCKETRERITLVSWECVITDCCWIPTFAYLFVVGFPTWYCRSPRGPDPRQQKCHYST